MDDSKLILTGVYMHKFSNIELIALRPSTMYAKTGVKTTVATSRTGALHWQADAAEKKSGTRTPKHVVALMPSSSCHKDLIF